MNIRTARIACEWGLIIIMFIYSMFMLVNESLFNILSMALLTASHFLLVNVYFNTLYRINEIEQIEELKKIDEMNAKQRNINEYISHK